MPNLLKTLTGQGVLPLSRHFCTHRSSGLGEWRSYLGQEGRPLSLHRVMLMLGQHV